MLAIACLSQKGGVGKSTLARLIARTYAQGTWQVKIADFNVKQKTSVDWAALRMSQNVRPEIPAEPFTDVSKALRGDNDLVVFDGRPESDPQSLRLAQDATVVVVPTGVSGDDLAPQVRFAHELRSRGIDNRKILFVLNKTPDSEAAVKDARNYIEQAGYAVAKTHLPMKVAYINAHNIGRCIAETEYPSLNDRSMALAKEIIAKVEELQ
ncbi:ParA family protein [Bradyrhizobium sp. 179]|uniref:ParA family protein n=1 Tax=Bradyrhizobium sp. 179 TaxID=2782648 RepID=UPI001FF7F927|nr:ParA family protein [Bradyrhizobium sp. 179]MCK1543398.1 ParA family protein [Bradyrhizobium sp. 179]